MPAFRLNVITEPPPIRISTTRKNTHAIQLDSAVASPAPSTSYPSGSSTNINSGSSAMFRRPPSMIPAPASLDLPMLRIRLESTLESTVGMPPKTITQKAYCLAYSYVFVPAPRSPRIGFMKTPMTTENTAAIRIPRYREKTLTLLASSFLFCPSRRDISAPPPIPASPARQSVILNTGRIRDVPATIYGLFVCPT